MTALFSALFTGLAVIVLAVTLVWLLSLVKRDVRIHVVLGQLQERG